VSTADERIARLERQVEALLVKVEEQATEIAALRAESLGDHLKTGQS
jgi:hypothetical protein